MERVKLFPWKGSETRNAVEAEVESSVLLTAKEVDAVSYSIRRAFWLAFEGSTPTFNDIIGLIHEMSPTLSKKLVSISCDLIN